MAETFDIVTTRAAEGLALYLRARESQRLFRVRPTRDPNQPRLWCLCVEQYSPTNSALGTAPSTLFMSPGAMARDKLLETLDAIRMDPAGWLDQVEQHKLRQWLRKLSTQPMDEMPTAKLRSTSGTLTARLSDPARDDAKEQP